MERARIVALGLHGRVEMTFHSFAVLSLGLALAACSGAEDASPDFDPDWRPTSWPTTFDDPVAAAEQLFQPLEGRWELTFTSADRDQPCEALDCPGDRDGWDPPPAYDVTSYFAIVRAPAARIRFFEMCKVTVDSNGSGLGIVGCGAPKFYRGERNGDLRVQWATDAELNGPDDYGDLAFASMEGHVQVAATDPYGVTDTVRIELDVETDTIVVESIPAEGQPGQPMAFRAPRLASTVPAEALMEVPFDELLSSTPDARLLELFQLALDSGWELRPHIMEFMTHPSADVRRGAIEFELTTYLGLGHPCRLFVQDQLLARLLDDPEISIRRMVADGILAIWSSEEGFFFHCQMAEGVTACAETEPDPGVRATCAQILTLTNITRHGNCPWQAPEQ